MKAFNDFHFPKLGSLTLVLLSASFLSSCVMTEGYYGDTGGSYYGEPSYASSYYGHSSGYNRPYYRDNDYYGHDSHRYEAQRYQQRDSRVYHANEGQDHNHPQTTNSDKFRLLNYREDKKSSHPSGYHDADYWKSRGYSVKKNTFEKKDGKIVGSRKDIKSSKHH